MKVNLGKIFFLILFLCLATMAATAATLKGTIIDKQTHEPLTGATVQIVGTSQGTIADINGHFSLELSKGNWQVLIRYVGYKDLTVNISLREETMHLLCELQTDAQTLSEVTVVARKNLEGERALQLERQKASLAIENLGSKEMSLKGIGNVQEGVKKLTGISIAQAGQLIVRGLGDRYSITTLNGLPVASPNPDHKLIPLNLFPSSIVQNITVSKVYDATAFADYSGAHINISTKEQVSNRFLSLSFQTGGNFQSIGQDRWQMDRKGTLFQQATVDQDALNMPLLEFDQYVKQHNIFDTSFETNRHTTLPDLGGNLGFGHNFEWGQQTLNILGALSIKNNYQNNKDCFYKTLEASGNVQDDFSYDSYEQNLEMAALGYAGLKLRKHNHVGYTFFYARNATDTYQRREGMDAENHELVGSHQVTHIYTLQNHQWNGWHPLDNSHQWELSWGASYSKTSSEEPDRRQVMFLRQDDGSLSLFKLNRQETMRYFGSLDEDEWNAQLGLSKKWNEKNQVKIGFNFKDKNRNYQATRFYYNLHKINPEINDIYHTDGFLNQTQVADGQIIIQRIKQPKDSYQAGHRIMAGYLVANLSPVPELMVNVGIRYERSQQWVEYATDGGEWFAHRRELNQHDFFPTLNLKYNLNPRHTLRLAASRTITRPAFIEMAPFLYQEAYGAAQIRGNEALQNGYNYNIDLRYEWITEQGDLFSITGYFKYLDKPIERIQALQGGATLHSFQNADHGVAGGLEAELRKQVGRDLRIGGNVSYMYTNVKLPQGGAYTNKERPLQGASPLLVNADITYSPLLGKNKPLNVVLLYNLQGKRIHSVGVSGLGDVKQDPVHLLNFTIGYQWNQHISTKVQVNDLLNRATTFRQEIPTTHREMVVERYKPGSHFEIGLSWKL